MAHTVFLHSPHQDAKGEDEGSQIRNKADTQHYEQAVREVITSRCERIGEHVVVLVDQSAVGNSKRPVGYLAPGAYHKRSHIYGHDLSTLN
jgi:hypothetical protein